MNLIQRAMQATFGKGQSASATRRREHNDRWFAVGTRNAGNSASRQATRARLRDEWHAILSGEQHPEMPRKERRALARARAAGDWKTRKVDTVAA